MEEKSTDKKKRKKVILDTSFEVYDQEHEERKEDA